MTGGARRADTGGRRGADRGGVPARGATKLPPSWGAVARRGVRVLLEADTGGPARTEVRRRGSPAPAEQEQWVLEEVIPSAPVRAAARRRPAAAVAAAASRARRAPPAVGSELAAAVGSRRAALLEARLMQAARAYERERWREARRLVAPIAREAPGAPSVRELHGLVLYRLGRWAEAAHELEAFRSLTGSCEQHPVLADCYRALGRHERVEQLWDELRRGSPGAALVAEGRIVMAGSLADRGRLDEAIALLERAPTRVKRPAEHHARLWYALADLYERAGDLPRARELFARVVAADPELADAPERLAALG